MRVVIAKMKAHALALLAARVAQSAQGRLRATILLRAVLSLVGRIGLVWLARRRTSAVQQQAPR